MAEQDTQNKNATGTSGSTSGSSSSSGGGTGSGQESNTVNEIASQVGGVLRGDTGAAKGIISQVKETTTNAAGGAFGQVREKAVSTIDEQKATLAQSLGSVAQTVRQVGETVKGSEAPEGVVNLTAQYSDTLARQIEQFSSYLEKNNVSDMLRQVERFARRNPAYFIGGAFALGLLGARFLKSSNPNESLMRLEGAGSGTSSGGRSNGGRNNREVFHHHSETNESGEGVRPV